MEKRTLKLSEKKSCIDNQLIGVSASVDQLRSWTKQYEYIEKAYLLQVKEIELKLSKLKKFIKEVKVK